MVSSVQGGKKMWCLLFTLAKLSGVLCPRWQKNVVSFVHPGKNSLVSFGSGVFCPTFILSTDLFKVHGNGLLDRLVKTGRGCHIGEICCVAPTCADDMFVLSDTQDDLQLLLNIAVDNSIMEKYVLLIEVDTTINVPFSCHFLDFYCFSKSH